MGVKVTQNRDIIPESKVKPPFIPEISINKLPSKFLSYPKDSLISYRPYLFGELSEFNDSKLPEYDVVSFITRGITTSFPIEKLTYFDYLYISLLRKVSSFGTGQFTFNYLCTKCGKINSHQDSLENIEFDELNIPILPIVTSIGETEINFSPLTLGKYQELTKTGDILKKDRTFAAMVTNMDYEKAKSIIYNATGEDHSVLNMINEMLYFGIKPIKLKCENIIDTVKEIKCDEENTIELDSPEVLVRPFRGDNTSIRNRIHFGL